MGASERLRGWVIFLALVVAPAPVLALDILWSTSATSYGESIVSVQYPGPATDKEAADDFEAYGSIERLLVSGRNDCTFECFDPPLASAVWVRFYEWTPTGPGSLQDEQVLLAGDPGFLYDTVDGAKTLDLTLPQPFVADGWHFLSVQMVFDEPFNWRRFQSNFNAPINSNALQRDNLGGGGWQQTEDYWGNPVSQDFAFTLYGCPPGGCEPAPLVAGCGEWSEIPSPNPVGDARLGDVDAHAPWDVWAVGYFNGPVEGYWEDRQQSLAMHWDGSAWSIVPTPSPSPSPSTTQVSLAAVSAIGTNDVWAVGRKRDQDAGGYTGGRVFAVHWNGFEWTDMNAPWPQDQDGTPFTGASGEELIDVAAVASDDVWLVGRYWSEQPSGVITWPGVAMHWNGSSFEVHELPMVSPQGNQLAAAVAAVATDDVWAVGSGEGTGEPAYIWHWDGSQWSHVPGPTPGVDRGLSAIAAIATDDVWAGGWYRDAVFNYFPLMLHWDGASWSEVPSPVGGSAFAVWGADNILAHGTGGWAHWDGASWNPESGPEIIPDGTTLGMDVTDPCELWVVGWKNAVQGETTLTYRLSATGNPLDDMDGDGVLNEVDNCPADYNPDQADCDGDGAGDVCELVSGDAQDCNGNATPDNCEIFDDCNLNGVPDTCETDCNTNGLPDECDITTSASADCNTDGVPDECETVADCNTNGVNDWCDINDGSSTDANVNGFPDECEAIGPDIATVNTSNDVVDFGGGQRMADLPGPDGLVSFREALMAVNNTPGPQTVAFNVPPAAWDTTLGDDKVTLRLEDGIFGVTDDETTIDFTTQTQFTGDTNPAGGEVGIYGFEPNAWGVAAIWLFADDCTVIGLDRVMQRGYAVQIAGNGNRVIGSTISGPIHAGVYITGGFEGPIVNNNVIGGVEPGEGNFLSGGDDGVRIDGPAADNVVIGNVITGGASGVAIRGGATGNRVGGPTPAERNVISGAGYYGEEGCPTGEQVEIWNSSGNVIEGNYIGTISDGSASEGQRGTAGIRLIDSPDNVIRDNVISGIRVVGTNHCSGEVYGTAVDVYGASSNNVIEANLVGVDATGQLAIPNRAGIAVSSWPGSGGSGATLVRENLVAHNETDGVRVGFDVTGVTITGNAIFDNGLLGISLAGGAGNGGQPAPLLTSVTTDDVSVTVTGTVSGAANRSFSVEFFANASCDPSGFGEGEVFLGSVLVTTDGSGVGSFEATLPVVVIAGEVVTATATDITTGNTSEFSACETVVFVTCSVVPPEVSGVMVAPDLVTVSWNAFGPSIVYDVARGTVSELRDGQAPSCLANGVTDTWYEDSAMPVSGDSYYYLVRGRNECGAGPWGAGGFEGLVCP